MNEKNPDPHQERSLPIPQNPKKRLFESTATKNDLIQAVADTVECCHAPLVVQKVLDALVELILTKGRVEIRDFGVFEVQLREERRTINPRNHEITITPAKAVVVYRPGKKLREAVQSRLTNLSPKD
ncbi:MAG: HU family DNA-binding protein [Planctomycetia bacterium]|nr:HU family DNA-binding protein [Planctomycetia bacterium]